MPLSTPCWSTDEVFVVPVPPDVAQRIARFTSAPTRMLLSSDGLTTPLLEAWAGSAVEVRWAEQRRVRAGDAPTGAGTLLRSCGDSEVMVRHSVLAACDGRTLSRNVVVTRLDLVPAAEQCVTDTSSLLGERLHAAGTGFRRSVLDAGCRDWEPPSGEPAAYKTYILWHGNEPLATISELFNPDVVPAMRTHRRWEATR